MYSVKKVVFHPNSYNPSHQHCAGMSPRAAPNLYGHPVGLQRGPHCCSMVLCLPLAALPVLLLKRNISEFAFTLLRPVMTPPYHLPLSRRSIGCCTEMKASGAQVPFLPHLENICTDPVPSCPQSPEERASLPPISQG